MIYYGTLTKVSGDEKSGWVKIPERSGKQVFGPVPMIYHQMLNVIVPDDELTGADTIEEIPYYKAGDKVIVATISANYETMVVLGRL